MYFQQYNLILAVVIVAFIRCYVNATGISKELEAVATTITEIGDNDKTSQVQTYDDHDDRDELLVFNATKIINILHRLDYLTIYLNHSIELNNNFIQLLLTQKVCPLQIFIGRNTRHGLNSIVKHLKLNFYIPPLHRVVTVQSGELYKTLIRFISKKGNLFCLIFGKLNMLELKETAEQIWNDYKIHRIYYITRLNTLFYNPFARPLNEQNKYGEFLDANIYLMDSIFSNMNGYPMRTYIFDSAFSTVYGDRKTETITSVKGVDSEAALLLGEKLNFTPIFQWPNDEFFGARLENGSFNGAIGRIIRGETDIVMSGFFIKDYLTREIIFTVAVYMDELCCYVAKARKIPQSILPIFAVHVDIWIGFFSIGLLTPFIWMVLRYINLVFLKRSKKLKKSHPFRTRYQYIRIFNDTWVIWVRCAVLRFSQFNSERIFLTCLCLISVIYGAIFDSSLATVYIRPLYYKDINTLQELDDAGFRVYIKHPAMRDDIFYGHSSHVYKNLNRKIFLIGETEERLISMMAKRGGFAAVTRGSALLLDDIRYFITKKIHKIPECPKNYHIGFVLPKYSPFENPFNIELLYFLQGGFINVWTDEMMHQAKTRIHTYADYNNNDNEHFWKVLTLKDLQLAFYALFIGCSLATISLIGEIYFKNRKNLKNYFFIDFQN